MWQVEFTAKAAKQFSKLDSQTQREIVRYLERIQMTEDPRSSGKALVGDFSGLWRYRVGKYRLICEIYHDRLVIELVMIGKRDHIYD